MSLLPSEALALMDKIELAPEVLDKMGVDKTDEAMVTGVKFMMVDTGMDEDTVQMVGACLLRAGQTDKALRFECAACC